MKNYIFLPILLVLICLAGCSNGSEKNLLSYKSYGLNQKVKSIRVTTYEAESKFGEIVKGDILRYGELNYVLFNQDGLVSEEIHFDDEGVVTSKFVNMYDKKNRWIEMVDYDGEGSMDGKWISTYNGKLLTKMVRYDEEGNETMKCEYMYNGKLLTKIVRYDEEGNETMKYEYMYKKGKMLSTRYLKEGRLQWEEKYERKNGLRTKSVRFDSQGKEITTCDYFYDHKRLIKEVCVYADGEQSEWEYEYDPKGNWIKRITFEGEARKPKVIAERVIEYW